jgi:hypothetical protein
VFSFSFFLFAFRPPEDFLCLNMRLHPLIRSPLIGGGSSFFVPSNAKRVAEKGDKTAISEQPHSRVRGRVSWRNGYENDSGEKGLNSLRDGPVRVGLPGQCDASNTPHVQGQCSKNRRAGAQIGRDKPA